MGPHHFKREVFKMNAKSFGWVLGLITIAGVIINLKDIIRYIKMKTM